MGFGGVVCGGCSVGWMLTNAAIGHQGLLLAVISMLMGMKLAQASFRLSRKVPEASFVIDITSTCASCARVFIFRHICPMA